MKPGDRVRFPCGEGEVVRPSSKGDVAVRFDVGTVRIVRACAGEVIQEAKS